MKNLLALILLLNFFAASAQDTIPKQQPKSEGEGVYNMRLEYDIPITVVGFVATYFGNIRVRNKDILDSADIAALDTSKLPFFDRPAIHQDPEYYKTAHEISDVIMYSSFGAPFLLFLDPAIRGEYFDVMLLYLQTHAITGNIYAWGVGQIHRKRPLVWNPNLPFPERLGNNKTNSFYSGHVASTAASTFFIAKVLNDYHPEWERRWLLFVTAGVVPATIGVFRYKAGKHFPSDIVAGLAGGAATGILVPHIHKRIDKNLSFAPVINRQQGMYGLSAALKF